MSPEEMEIHLSNRFHLRGAWACMAALALVPVWFAVAGGVRWQNVAVQWAEYLKGG